MWRTTCLLLWLAVLACVGASYDSRNLPTDVVDLLTFQPIIPDPGVAWYKNISADDPASLYQSRQYNPSAANDRGHNLGSWWDRENDFNVKDEDYKQGLLSMGIAFVAFGVVILLCIPMAYCCMAKVKCCCRKEKNKSLLNSNVRWWYVWVSLCTIGFSIVYMCGIIFLDHNINEWEDSVYAIGDAFGAVSDLSRQIISITNAALQAYVALGNAARACPLVDDTEAARIFNKTLNVTVLQDRIDASIDELSTITGLNYTQLQYEVYDIADSIANTDEARRIVCYTLLAMLIVVLGAYVVAGWFNFFAAKARKGAHTSTGAAWFSCLASPVAIMVVVACMIFTGASVVLAAGSGDYCQDPDAKTQLTFDEEEGTTLAGLVEYYTTCNATAYEQIEQYTYTVRALYVKNVNDISPVLNDAYDIAVATQDTCPQVLQAYTQMDQDLFLAWVALLKLSLIVECPLINSLYELTIYDTFCADLSYAVNVMFAGALGLSVTLAITMVLYRLMIVQKKVQEEEETQALVEDFDGVAMRAYNTDGKEGEDNKDGGGGGGGNGDGGDESDGDGADANVRSPLKPRASQKRERVGAADGPKI